MATQYTSSLPWITGGTTPTITFTTPFNANMIVVIPDTGALSMIAI